MATINKTFEIIEICHRVGGKGVNVNYLPSFFNFLRGDTSVYDAVIEHQPLREILFFDVRCQGCEAICKLRLFIMNFQFNLIKYINVFKETYKAYTNPCNGFHYAGTDSRLINLFNQGLKFIPSHISGGTIIVNRNDIRANLQQYFLA